MKFSCDDCGAQYMIADEKIGPRGVKVRCKKCAHVIILRPPKSGSDAKGVHVNGGGPVSIPAPSIPEERARSSKRGAPPPPPQDEGPDEDEATVAVPTRHSEEEVPLGVSSDLGLSKEFAAHGFDKAQEQNNSPFAFSNIGGSLRDIDEDRPDSFGSPGLAGKHHDDEPPAKTSVDALAGIEDEGTNPEDERRNVFEVATRVGKVSIPEDARRDEDEVSHEDAAREKPTEEHRPPAELFGGSEKIGARLDKLQLSSLSAEEATIDRSDSDLDADSLRAPPDGNTDEADRGDLDALRGALESSDLGSGFKSPPSNGSTTRDPLPMAARGVIEAPSTKRTSMPSGAAAVNAIANELDAEIGSAFEAVFGSGAGMVPGGDPFEDAKEALAARTRGDSGIDDKKPTKVFDVDAMRRLQVEQDIAAERNVPEPPAPPPAPPSEALVKEWYVAISDEQVGPLDLDEIQSRWSAGEIDLNTLCWKQGMPDWVAIRFARDLESVVGADGKASASSDLVPAAKPRDRSSVARDRAPVEAKPVISQALEREEPEHETSDSSEESEASWKPSAASALASLARAEIDGSPESSAPKESSSTRSSLIPDKPFAGEKLTASMFGAGEHTVTRSGGSLPKAPELASSVSLRDPSSVRKPQMLWVAVSGLGLLVVVLLGVMIYFLARSPTPAQPPQVAIAPVAPQAALAPAPVPAAAGAVVPADPSAAAPAQPAGAVPAAAPAAAAQPAAEPPAAAAAPAAAAPPAAAAAASEGKREKRKAGSAVREPKEKVKREEAAPPPPAPEPKKSNFDADDLLAEGSRKKSAAPVADSSDDLPDKLDDADILRVLRKYKNDINTCREKQAKADPNLEGVMTVKFVILNTGKTSQHAVQPDKFKGSAVGKCVLDSVRGWSFPRFRTGSMPLDFPVMVKGRG
jgi:predicted Zn finger-like uncharacterized protein